MPRPSAPAAALGFALLLSAGAQAQQPAAGPATKDEAERAEAAERQVLPEDEFRELTEDAPLTEEQEQERREQQAREAAVAGPTYEELHPEEINIFWDRGIRIERNDKRFRMKIGGRLQLDSAWVDSDSDMKALFDTGWDYDVRRGWLEVTGALRNRFIYKAQVDLAGNSAGDDGRNRYVRQLYVGWTVPGTLNGVRLGVSKEPFTMADSTSAMALPLMERPLPIVFSPSYNLGVLVNGQQLDQTVSWAVGAFRYSGHGGGSQRLDLTGRVTHVPWAGDDDSRLLHLGAAYSHQFRDDFTLRYRRRPESQLADRYVDTGEMQSDGVDLFGAELAGKWGAAAFQSEFVSSLVNRSDGPDTGFWGAYVSIAYMLTGEQRPYSRRRGTFTRVSPRRSFSWRERRPGAWEVTARYSYLDLDNRDIRGGRLLNATLGLGWYLTPGYSLFANYVHSHLKGVGNSRIFQIRFQIEY